MSEVKTNKISSVSTNGDITLDPDGTGNTIIASGNVGIGNTTPGSFFSGSTNLVVGSGSGDGGMTIYSGTSDVGNIKFADGTGSDAAKTAGGIRYDHSSGFMRFDTNDGSERLKIRSDGKVSFNATAFAGSAFAHANFPAAGIAIVNADTNGHYRAAYQSSNQNHYWTNGSNQAYLSSAGAWTDASDVAYKKDITDATYGITTVKAMQPRFYYIKDDAIEDDSRQLGFIAQELEVHVPEVVTGSDGSKGVEYGHLTAGLTKALQEAIAKIEALEARVTALEDA